MPSYKGIEWGDEGCDAITYLSESDPMELESMYRQALFGEARAHLKLIEENS